MFDDEKLQSMVLKLLDKAGHDPRLTPKILREKAEERLKLPKQGLKDKRETIKEIILHWWCLNKKSDPLMTNDELQLKSLMKLAKALGKGPSWFQELIGAETSFKISYIREKYAIGQFRDCKID
jgi:hypothetical protein